MKPDRSNRRSMIFAALGSLALVLVAASGSAATGFLTGPQEGEPLAIAEGYLAQNRAALGLTARDLADKLVSDQYTTRHNGVTHIYFVQHYAGIKVFRGILNVNVAADGSVINVGNRFVSDLAGAINATAPALTAAQAVQLAAADLGLAAPAALPAVASPGGAAQEVVFAGAGLSQRDIPAGLKIQPLGPGVARLVWDVAIEPDEDHYWQVKVDAVTGKIQHKANLVETDSYRVYEWPAESPNHVTGTLPPGDGRTVVTETAADATASPFGWHDLNGLAGADTINTTGNNVFAQTDLDANDVFTPGVDVQPISATRDFDFGLDLTQGPETYREAAVTNLFYWNNINHDLHYLYGFDEASGNFQINNYLNGGIGNDAVLADAQDGSGTNNANMLTLGEGVPPRMQMFVWLPTTANEVVVNSPAGFGPYPASGAAFGPALDQTGETGDVVLVDDGVGTGADACEPIGQDLTGKIGLADRGTCSFVTKARNIQEAGGIAMILVNVQSDDPVSMGDDGTGIDITIPSVMVGLSNGNELKSALPANATVRNSGGAIPNRDSDLDNGVIIHEYGHGVSNRLTGGPSADATPFCLSSDQQAGEGWSDWWALAFTQRAGADGSEPRGIGTYVIFQDPPDFGGGIRPFPYSTDMSINPQTYGDLATGTLSVPHGVGSVWATTIWDMYWAIVNGVPELGLAGAGFREDLYDLTAPLAGNQIAIQLVTDGLKLQVCDPTFLDARDAILAADLVNNDGAFQCHIWHAFARRGMGVGANDAGGTLAVSEDFAIPAACQTGACQAAPTFNGATGVVSNTDGTYTLTVTWQPATDNCDSGSVTYSVFRSTDPAFVPGPGNQIASGVTGTSFADTQVENGVEYYYVVRATDGLGNTDTNTVRRRETPVGELTAGGSFFDDAGDTQAHLRADLGTWAVRATGGVGGSRVYATSAAGNYPDDSCLRIESDTLYLGANPTLTFATKYDVEPAWDGGIVEISTAGGAFADWTKLDSITYPGLMIGPLGNTSCPNPGLADGEMVFNGTTGGLFLPVSGSLADFANQAVRIRYVFGSDAGTNDLGWFNDDIGIDDVRQAGACEPGDDDGGETDGRVHGAGWWATNGKKLNFSFDARAETDGSFSGKLKVKDKDAGVDIDASSITGLSAGDGDCNGQPFGPNGFVFTATGSFNGSSGATFRACGEDAAQPGKTGDRLYVECVSGCSYDTASRTADDVIDGGNIHLHDPIGGSGGSAAAGNQAEVVELDPILLGEAPVGTPLALVARVHTPAAVSLEGRSVTLQWKRSNGKTGSQTALADAAGVAVFAVTVAAGETEYVATADGVESNAISVTGKGLLK